MSEKINKTVTACPYCKKLTPLGRVHSCSQEIMDLDEARPRMRKAVVKMKVEWAKP
jgi:hypothetical protein